jgi:hypothetical protein
MIVSTRTLVIAFVVVAAIGFGWFMASGRRGGVPPDYPNGPVTATVTDFMKQASASSWNTDAVADRIYMEDQDATRIPAMRLALNDLGGRGPLESVRGKINGTSYEPNSMSEPVFTWTGVVTLVNGGGVPVTAEVVQHHRDYKISRVHVMTESDAAAGSVIDLFFGKASVRGWTITSLDPMIYADKDTAKRKAKVQSVLDQLGHIPSPGEFISATGEASELKDPVGNLGKPILRWKGKVSLKYIYLRLTVDLVKDGDDWKIVDMTPG